MSVSFLLKLLALTWNFIKKETLAQVISCEFCQISKNTSLNEHFWATASVRVSTHSNTVLSQEKTFQRLNIPYRVLYKDALTNNHVRCVSSNQIIHELNKIIYFSCLIMNLLLKL